MESQTWAYRDENTDSPAKGVVVSFAMALTHWRHNDHRMLVSHKAEAATVSITEENLVSYDLEGRFLGSYDQGVNIRRGLDNAFQQRWRIAGPGRPAQLRQRNLTGDEAEGIIEERRRKVAALLNDEQMAQAYPETAEVLRRIAGYTYERLSDSGRNFIRIYGHIPILPPDQYRALVVQATDGCSYNRCTFCTLYRDKSYRVRSPEDFQRHIQEVLDFTGEGLSYRNSLFLGDANAVAVPTERLLALMDILQATAAFNPLLASRGIHAFLDMYTGVRKSVEEYRRLREHGLRRVSLGIETGSEALLALVEKPGTRQDVLELVRGLKEADIAVVVIFMIGLGGHRFREEHLAESAMLLQSLPLGKGDLVYLSRFAPHPAAPYLQRRDADDLLPFGEETMLAEINRWKEALTRRAVPRGVKVAPYSFQRFIY